MSISQPDNHLDVRFSPIVGLAQALAECCNTHVHVCSLPGVQYPDFAISRRLLRACCERPSRRADEQRDELAAPHSITSSARASRVGGMSRPSALAVFRLMISSTLAD